MAPTLAGTWLRASPPTHLQAAAASPATRTHASPWKWPLYPLHTCCLLIPRHALSTASDTSSEPRSESSSQCTFLTTALRGSEASPPPTASLGNPNSLLDSRSLLSSDSRMTSAQAPHPGPPHMNKPLCCSAPETPPAVRCGAVAPPVAHNTHLFLHRTTYWPLWVAFPVFPFQNPGSREAPSRTCHPHGRGDRTRAGRDTR